MSRIASDIVQAHPHIIPQEVADMGQFPDFDLHYVAQVLAEIWGREHGCEVKITLTPKEEVVPTGEEGG